MWLARAVLGVILLLPRRRTCVCLANPAMLPAACVVSVAGSLPGLRRARHTPEHWAVFLLLHVGASLSCAPGLRHIMRAKNCKLLVYIHWIPSVSRWMHVCCGSHRGRTPAPAKPSVPNCVGPYHRTRILKGARARIDLHDHSLLLRQRLTGSHIGRGCLHQYK